MNLPYLIKIVFRTNRVRSMNQPYSIVKTEFSLGLVHRNQLSERHKTIPLSQQLIEG